MVSTAAFHDSVLGSFPGLCGLKDTKMLLSHPLVKLSIVGNLRDRKAACLTSAGRISKFEFCVWMALIMT